MAATSVTNIHCGKNGHDFVYADYFGRSTDPKPTTGVFNGSTFLEAMYDGDMFAGKWTIYIFDGPGQNWLPFAQWNAPEV